MDSLVVGGIFIIGILFGGWLFHGNDDDDDD